MCINFGGSIAVRVPKGRDIKKDDKSIGLQYCFIVYFTVYKNLGPPVSLPLFQASVKTPAKRCMKSHAVQVQIPIPYKVIELKSRESKSL
jgi:hypothetical protein